jgi:hypothetical protein
LTWKTAGNKKGDNKTMKRYIPIKNEKNSENFLRIMMDYSLGGVNWYNSAEEKRGYYLYCSPVEKKISSYSNGEPFVTYTETVGKGGKFLLKEVSRQSKKAKEEACLLAKQKTEELDAIMAKLATIDTTGPVTQEKLDAIKAIADEFSVNPVE